MPVVVIPPPYRGPTGGVARVEVAGDTVRACLDAVEERHPGLRSLVLDDGDRVHRFVKLFRNGDPLEGDPLAAPLAAADELEILAAIGGG